MGNNINIPYSAFINGGVRDGMEMVISGTPKPTADKFSINLCSAQTVDQGDVAFHFNPRFNQGCVVRNHKQGRGWGAEETAGGLPLQRGRPFTLQIQVRNQGFKVFLNQKHFCDFTFRLPLSSVQFLFINGDITLQSIHLKEERASSHNIIPYSSFIHGGIYDGLDMVITGVPRPQCDRFSINLCKGATQEQGDIAFHFNPRFSQGCVVRNHRQGNTWGAEELAGLMPFIRGQHFTLNLKVLSHGYQVLVNGKHFCDFIHRLPKESVQYIHVKGDVNIGSVEFRRQSPQISYPGAAAGSVTYPHSVPNPNPVYSPVVPATVPIQGGFYPGKIIQVTGMPHIGGSRFNIDLVCGYSQFSDLAFHFDVRFNYGNDRGVVVRNHRQGGQYGVEEKHQPFFPFVQNANFEMMILCEPHCIKVAVNNQHFIEFNHRVQPLNLVDHLQVNGDVTVHQIRFQ
ncbi:hypothetical protein RRG08_019587 [Elysia crispata]|uniref:Galectin n=1 Tax=Elysia crispata TaxID=231223 RepID=A0AAE0ZEH1_9GAST|nr:hypothetical protein RRG08_019587 [Elysia crispata]